MSKVLLNVTGKAALLAAALASVSPAAGMAQETARVRTSENLRKDPNGEVLARLEPGAPLSVVDIRDGWVQVDVEGWVWARSLQVARREGLDLVVFESEGENLRDAPSGTILGRLGRGTLLEELERRPGWIRVRRRAWIWDASVVRSAPPAAVATTTPDAPSGSIERPPTRRGTGFAAAGTGGAAILSAPGGDTIGQARPRTDMELVAREGSWARVRLEGWTWLPEADSSAARSGEESELTPAALRREPARYRGRVVVWDLQFISLERAEKVRTDFFEGEPFLLTRYGGSDGPFVYVAVPSDRAREYQGLVPLERLTVTGRVRTGASSLTGTPIVDLVSLGRARDTR